MNLLQSSRNQKVNQDDSLALALLASCKSKCEKAIWQFYTWRITLYRTQLLPLPFGSCDTKTFFLLRIWKCFGLKKINSHFSRSGRAISANSSGQGINVACHSSDWVVGLMDRNGGCSFFPFFSPLSLPTLSPCI